MSPLGRFLFGRLFPWPFILAGGAAFYFGASSVHRSMESESWPAAEGRIQNSSVQYHRSNKSGTYHAEVFYSFTVDGQSHSGNTVAFGDYGSSNPSHAQQIVNRYPKGKVVSVRYLPTDHDVCVLEPGFHTQALLLPGVGSVFLIAGTLMAIFLPRLMRQPKKDDHPEHDPARDAIME
jgi:hypothetical protein